jgi:hypothetical protein
MIETISAIVGTLVGGFGSFIAIYLQSKKLHSDNRADFEVFKNEVRTLVDTHVKNSLESVKNTINIHDIAFLDNEAKFNDIKRSLELISCQNREQTILLNKHEDKISMYESMDSLLREVRNTVKHSMDILDKNDRLVASEYLYLVSHKVCEMIEYVQGQGLITLSRLEFDAFMVNTLNECKTKFANLFGVDKASAYFRNQLPIYNYKEELFKLLDDSSVNNIERRFRTLTIKWLEELCANFIRIMYMKGGNK